MRFLLKSRMKIVIICCFVVVSVLSCRPGGSVADDYELVITSLDTRSESSFRAINVINDRVVWASGSSGEILLTSDGGQTWKRGTIPGCENEDFRSIHAWNAVNAIVFGVSNPGRGYMTKTAGEDWDIVYEMSSDGIFFNSVCFADNMRGIALSDPIDSLSFVIRTRDGGVTWERVTGLPVLMDGEFNFAASNSCIDYHSSGMVWIITGGSNARVFRSEDHGISWTVSETGIIHGNPASGIFSVSFLNDNDGVIVGGTFDNPAENINIAAYTDDGGVTWELSEQMPAEYRSSVVWLKDKEKDIILATGKTGCDLSLDRGRTWSHISDEGYYTARPVPGTNSGFFAGSGGRIARFDVFKSRDIKVY